MFREGVTALLSKIDNPWVKLLEKAGNARLSDEQLAWIRRPEVVDQSVSRVDVLLEKQAFITACRQNKACLSYDSFDGRGIAAYDVFHAVAVYGDIDPGISPTDPVYPNPSYLVADFIDFVADSPNTLSPSQQFEKLLDISPSRSVVEACAIGMMASRIVARNIDHRIYPDIIVTEEVRDKWAKNVMPFSTKDKAQDVLGDNYYFWTKLYLSTALDCVEHLNYGAIALDSLAVQVMNFSRIVLANQPVVADHSEAVKAASSISRALIANVPKKL